MSNKPTSKQMLQFLQQVKVTAGRAIYDSFISSYDHSDEILTVTATQESIVLFEYPILRAEIRLSFPDIYRAIKPTVTHAQAWNAANIGHESLLPLPEDKAIPLPVLTFLHYKKAIPLTCINLIDNFIGLARFIEASNPVKQAYNAVVQHLINLVYRVCAFSVPGPNARPDLEYFDPIRLLARMRKSTRHISVTCPLPRFREFRYRPKLYKEYAIIDGIYTLTTQTVINYAKKRKTYNNEQAIIVGKYSKRVELRGYDGDHTTYDAQFNKICTCTCNNHDAHSRRSIIVHSTV